MTISLYQKSMVITYTNNSAGLTAHIQPEPHIPDCSVYRFRHTFAVEYLRNDSDEFTFQYFMSHNNIKTTRLYLIFTNLDREHAHKLASHVNNWKL